MPQPSDLISADMMLLAKFAQASTPEAREALRVQFCSVCAYTEQMPDLDPCAECRKHHCGLRDPELAAFEWDWLLVAINGVVAPLPFPIPPQVIEQINNRIGSAGCVSVSLVSLPDGSTSWDLYTPTLRGVMHRVLLRLCSLVGGHPIASGLTEQDTASVADFQRFLKKSQVQTLGSLGKNQLEIVRATGVKRSTVQRWLKEKPVGLP